MSGMPGLRWLVLIVSWIALLEVAASAQDRPYAYYLLIDTSASMTETPRSPKVAEDWKESKLEAVRRELGRFCSALPTEADVGIYTFDVQLREGPSVAILGEEDRDQLREYFSQLDAKGKQTHLWRSLAVVLEKASQTVQATPGKMVRVLVFSDGEDTDPSSPGPEAVLQRYKDLIRDKGRLTYITLGYTLRSDYREILEKYGVRIPNVATPADIIPSEASFEWSPRKPVCKKQVKFIDCSGGVVRDYHWDFGDGSTSTQKSPSHVFEKAGTYHVELEIRSPTGESDTHVRDVVVGEHVPLEAGFAVKTEALRAGSEVSFESQCQGLIQAFKWDFGDATTSTRQDAEHVYAEPGEYTVRLEVTGAEGETDATEQGISVGPPLPPSVDFVPPLGPIRVDQPVQFVGQCGDQVDQWSWDFGDGSEKSNEQNPAHAFAKAGTFMVTLVATGPGGPSKPASREIKVLPPEPPRADFTVSASARTGESVQFFDRSQGPVEKHSWDFGDGSDPSTERDPTHKYAEPGKYKVTLKVTGPGGSDSASREIEVIPPKPEADFAFEPESGPGPVRINRKVGFRDDSSGTIEKRTWDFGDGSEKSNDENPAHAFAEPGTFMVSLTVEGPGGSDSKSKPIVVEPYEKPKAIIELGVTSTMVDQNVSFRDISKGDVTRAQWGFGDGSPAVDVDYSRPGAKKSLDHKYAEPGTYAVTLVVAGPAGEHRAEASITVDSKRIPPEARFTVDARSGRESLDVHFTNETIGTVAQYIWDFGDGSATLVQESLGDVDHTYGPGTYSPTLTAEGPEKFAVDRYALEDPIVVKPPRGWVGKNWWWFFPLVILLVGAAGAIGYFGLRYLNQRRVLRELSVLTGSISCKPVVPADAAWQAFAVSGEGASYTFSPADSLPPDAPAADRDRGLTATLTKSVDPTTLVESYELQLHRGDTSEAPATLEPGQDVQQGGYLFRYRT